MGFMLRRIATTASDTPDRIDLIDGVSTSLPLVPSLPTPRRTLTLTQTFWVPHPTIGNGVLAQK